MTAATSTEAKMIDHLAALEPGSPRYRVLVTALDFKRSWIELAEHLVQVQRTGDFKGWGYRTLAAYTSHELHLRRETADKLLRSYDFLETHEPAHLAAARAEPPTVVPDFQALHALAAAREDPELAEAAYRELRDAVFAAGGLSAAQVRAQVKDRKPKVAEREDPLARAMAALKLAERLYAIVLEEESAIPEKVATHVEAAIAGLRLMMEG